MNLGLFKVFKSFEVIYKFISIKRGVKNGYRNFSPQIFECGHN